MDKYVELARAYVKTIMNRGTATYRNGVLDFTHGEGGNNHIHLLGRDGCEIGYIWFDTHCGTSWPSECSTTLGFCGKSNGSCNGRFRDILCEMYPNTWKDGDRYLFKFTSEMFVDFMDRVIESIR